VILLDSITRLARAYNTIVPPSGKVLSGGVIRSIAAPKRFFDRRATSRKADRSPSSPPRLSIRIAHGRCIFEEFKDRVIRNHPGSKLWIRDFPAIDIQRSARVRKSC